jgi:predicted nucleic acid-binding protein
LKVIVDTCAWSLSLRRRDKIKIGADEQQVLTQLREAIRDGGAAIIGPVRQEILSGIRNQAQFSKVEALLNPFPDEELSAVDYVEAARLFNLCQDHGVQCGPTDILICAVAIRKQFGILTYDQGLKRCMKVLQTEGLIR